MYEGITGSRYVESGSTGSKTVGLADPGLVDLGLADLQDKRTVPKRLISEWIACVFQKFDCFPAYRLASDRLNCLRSFCATLVIAICCSFYPAHSIDASESDLNTALLLADVLRAARTEIASQQPAINNELIGDKGLTGEIVLSRILERLKATGTINTISNPEDDREDRLLRAQLDSIREIIDENQLLINKKGIGFKGFVPAVFAQLTNERFIEKVGDIAEMKVTAPIDLVRNRKARPDKWEQGVIESRFKSSEWTRGQLYSEIAEGNKGSAFRVMVPEYYGEACLACHGNPKGEMDITGYPKEGGILEELGGAISITLYQ